MERVVERQCDGYIGNQKYKEDTMKQQQEKFLRAMFEDLGSNDPEKIKLAIKSTCQWILEDHDLSISRGHMKDLMGTISNAVSRL